MPRVGGRPLRLSMPKSWKSKPKDLETLPEKNEKNAQLDKSKFVTPAGFSHTKLQNPSKTDHFEKDVRHPTISELQPKSLQNPTSSKLSEKARTILQNVKNSALPNLNSVTQKSQANQVNSSYLDMANAIVKDAQALNSRVEKLTKNANTVKSIIDRLESNENLDLSPNSTVLKKPSFWITTVPGLYFLIMEQLPKLFFHSDNDSIDDD